MKKIGLVDHYISEWHANNYPAWIAEVNEKRGGDYCVAYAWAEEDVSPVDGVTTDAWCAQNGIEKADTLEELCEKSDVVIILAPSSPEKHLPYAERVLPYGKRTYIDKTFAPNSEEAQAIFALSEKYGAPFFSTSALRYAEELVNFSSGKDIVLEGGGRSFEEYIIHLAEMAVVLMQNEVEAVRVCEEGKTLVCTLKNGETEMVLRYRDDLPYGVWGSVGGKMLYREINSPFFQHLMEDILTFFEKGEVPFPGKQTLSVMRLRDGLLQAEKARGEWVDL